METPERNFGNGKHARQSDLFADDRPIELPVFNHITIEDDESMTRCPKYEEENKNKAIPYFNSISRLMYAAGDLSSPDPESVMLMIGFMKKT